MPKDAYAIWQAKPNRLWRPAAGRSRVDRLRESGIANQTGVRDVGVGEQQGSVRNKRSF